jgi:coenzyme F420-reducing hydrogenase beta subunit
MMPMDSKKELNRIISDGFCIGCGACASVSEELEIIMQSDGQYRAQFAAEGEDSSAVDTALSVCPFSVKGSNEDELGQSLFEDGGTRDSQIGWYRDLYAGHVTEGSFRENGASGGVITWLLTQMLAQGMADAVIHVKKSDSDPSGVLFKYAVSRTVEEVAAGAKSRYYPIEFSQVLSDVRKTPGRYVFVGLPCFVKAIRRLALVDDVIRERIVYCVGLVCGHLKSKAFADCFGRQAGILPGDLKEIDFRVKIPGRYASDYGVLLRSSEIEVVKSARELFGSSWGCNFFRYSACDYCDDVFAETADVAVGDAWLPGYIDDSEGNCVVVVRSPNLAALFNEARTAGRVSMDSILPDLAAQSQAGGLRDRREGLAYRLYLKEKDGEWAPEKRVRPSCRLSRSRKKIYRLRMGLGTLSHKLWAESMRAGDFAVFQAGMGKMIRRYNRAYISFPARIACKVKQMVEKVCG